MLVDDQTAGNEEWLQLGERVFGVVGVGRVHEDHAEATFQQLEGRRQASPDHLRSGAFAGPGEGLEDGLTAGRLGFDEGDGGGAVAQGFEAKRSGAGVEIGHGAAFDEFADDVEYRLADQAGGGAETPVGAGVSG